VRINWFSPLPPSRTDIAQFTARILPDLCAHAEVTLWTAQDSWDVQTATVRRFDPAHPRWDILNQADVTIYNIGNDARFHSAFWEACREHSGFVIMHDVSLHDSISHYHRERGDRDGYLRIFESAYGARGRADAERYWSGAVSNEHMVKMYSCAPYVLASSLGAIVHSGAAREALQRDLPELPIVQLPLPYPPAAHFAGGFVPRLHAGSPPWRLIVFGFLGVNRGLHALLAALGALSIRDRFRLDIYGELYDRSAVSNLIHQLQLKNHVTIHGFVPEAELEAALASAHLAVNLRYPTMGEASGSQLRIWSHGLPSLVTRTGWYAELPQDTAAFVRPESMVEDIREHLEAYAAAPAVYAELGEKGYRYFAQRHSPAEYVKGILQLAKQASLYRARASGLYLADRTAETLDGWFVADRLPEYIDRLAKEICAVYGFPASS